MWFTVAFGLFVALFNDLVWWAYSWNERRLLKAQKECRVCGYTHESGVRSHATIYADVDEY